jgi:hypothetical protein
MPAACVLGDELKHLFVCTRLRKWTENMVIKEMAMPQSTEISMPASGYRPR